VLLRVFKKHVAFSQITLKGDETPQELKVLNAPSVTASKASRNQTVRWFISKIDELLKVSNSYDQRS
jgi:hypothetical protein